ncbi:uncharacterized protein LOC132716105 [Ruditapes philippinarum]|uniref:uncharacterized protein LOC132716105 n=1 Tax=Ruditapes philippinarum TaxID=129788 RepID=UPI00295BBB9E|nr:uncharacterized protein LOC132716105 [Ruditapes philippinarum]
MGFKTCLAAFLCALVLSNYTESMEPVDRECPRFAFEHKLLESLVRVEHAVTTLGSKFNNLEERMDRLESGHNCDKKAIAFTAVLDHKITFSSRDILKFNSVLNNAGNGYDPESGLFTAPLSGTYMFSFQHFRTLGY